VSGKIKKYVLPNLPYLLVFWFFAKCGQAYRLSPGADVLERFKGVLANLSGALKQPALVLDPFDLCVGFIGAAAFFGVVYYKKKTAKNWRRDVEYGSARWGGKKDIEPYIDPKPDNNIILTATESLTMNSRPKNPKHARNKNVLVVGGSGSGKTRFWLKPNIMQLHSSFCVTDPKGSILVECGKLLKDNGYEIKVLNTIDFKKSMNYNPFAYIRSEKDILKFVTALIANTKGEGKSGDDFWVKAETLLYCALIGYIMSEIKREDQNINSLVNMINAMEVREDDETWKNTVDYLFDDLAEKDPEHFAVLQYSKYKMAAGVIR